MPDDVGSGAIDRVSSHEIYEQSDLEREAQETQEVQDAQEADEEDGGHDADGEGDDGDEDDERDERDSEAAETADTTVSYFQHCRQLYCMLRTFCRRPRRKAMALLARSRLTRPMMKTTRPCWPDVALA
jgi:hypothetical protein